MWQFKSFDDGDRERELEGVSSAATVFCLKKCKLEIWEENKKISSWEKNLLCKLSILVPKSHWKFNEELNTRCNKRAVEKLTIKLTTILIQRERGISLDITIL